MNRYYEAPFAEIVEVDLVAIMTWSGIHDENPDPTTTTFEDPEEPWEDL